MTHGLPLKVKLLTQEVQTLQKLHRDKWDLTKRFIVNIETTQVTKGTTGKRDKKTL